MSINYAVDFSYILANSNKFGKQVEKGRLNANEILSEWINIRDLFGQSSYKEKDRLIGRLLYRISTKKKENSGVIKLISVKNHLFFFFFPRYFHSSCLTITLPTFLTF